MTRDYSSFAEVASQDFLTMLTYDPEAFDGSFYKAILTSKENPVSEIIEDVVGSVETAESRIDYEDPVPVRVKIVPDESLKYIAFEDGDGADYHSGEENGPIAILLNVAIVPQQSIISWTEKKDDTNNITLSYYILKSAPFGKAPVIGYIHYCIPLFNAEAKEGI